MVTCHLGAGASLAAVLDGHSVDTTMGFTPLDGLVMATRSGSVDPGVLLWLEEHEHLTPHDIATAQAAVANRTYVSKACVGNTTVGSNPTATALKSFFRLARLAWEQRPHDDRVSWALSRNGPKLPVEPN